MFVIITLCLLAGCSGSSSGSGDNQAQSGGGAASVSLTASSTQIAGGDRVTLNWSSSRASSCTASGGWSGSRPLSGSETVGPLTSDTTFTLSCSGDGGGGVQQVTVRVDSGGGSGGSGILQASPEYVEAGGTSTLSWDVPGASSCTASGGWSGSQPTSGSYTVGPISSTTTYQLNCTGPNGSELGMVTVQVVDKVLRWQAPTENVDGTPLTDLAGYVIYWGASSRDYSGSHTINSPTTTEWEATMAPGTYYFAMTAFDSENNESSYSNEVRKIIP